MKNNNGFKKYEYSSVCDLATELAGRLSRCNGEVINLREQTILKFTTDSTPSSRPTFFFFITTSDKEKFSS